MAMTRNYIIRQPMTSYVPVINMKFIKIYNHVYVMYIVINIVFTIILLIVIINTFSLLYTCMQ